MQLGSITTIQPDQENHLMASSTWWIMILHILTFMKVHLCSLKLFFCFDETENECKYKSFHECWMILPLCGMQNLGWSQSAASLVCPGTYSPLWRWNLGKDTPPCTYRNGGHISGHCLPLCLIYLWAGCDKKGTKEALKQAWSLGNISPFPILTARYFAFPNAETEWLSVFMFSWCSNISFLR